jgi:hypothetical protein
MEVKQMSRTCVRACVCMCASRGYFLLRQGGSGSLSPIGVFRRNGIRVSPFYLAPICGLRFALTLRSMVVGVTTCKASIYSR